MTEGRTRRLNRCRRRPVLGLVGVESAFESAHDAQGRLLTVGGSGESSSGADVIDCTRHARPTQSVHERLVPDVARLPRPAVT